MSDELDTGAAVRQYMGRQDQVNARVNLSAASGTSGDLEAELRAASRRTGVPMSSARAMPDVVKRRADLVGVIDAVQRYPSTLAFLAGQDNARIAHDDVDVLTSIEEAVGKSAAYLLGAGERSIGADLAAGAYRASRGVAGVAAAPLEFFAPLLDPLPGNNPLTQAAEAFRSMGSQAEAQAEGLSPPGGGLVQSGVSSGVQSLSQSLLALPAGAVAGSATLSTGLMAAMSGGQSYLRARERGKDVPESLVFGASDAAIEYATERIPVGRLFGDLKAGTPVFSTLWRQAVAEVPGEQVATVLQDLNEWAVLNQDKPFSEYLRERPSAAALTLIATLVGVGGNVAVMQGVQSTVDKVRGTDRQAEALAELMRAAANSKTRERDPVAFADFVQRAAADSSAPSEVFIDAREFAEALHQSGITPEQAAAALPSLAAQFTEAAAIGGDLVLPVGEIAAGVAGSPLEQLLMQHVRTTPDALSQAEAKGANDAAVKSLFDRTYAEQQTEQADTDSRDAVRQIVLGELNATGRFTPDVNEAYAEFTAQFFATQAARMGETAEALYAKYPLKVRAGGVFGDVLQQSDGLRAVQTMPRSPMTGNPVFDVFDAEGNKVSSVHVAKTADEAVQLVRDLPAKRAANAAAPPPVYEVRAEPKAPRSNWKIHRGEIDSVDGPDEFYYHVTTYQNARAILRDGLVPDVGGMFGGVYANYSRGKVFFTERDGVNFWREKVEAQLQHQFDNPPAVAVVRIPKTAVRSAQIDDLGTRDASAGAYFVESTLFQNSPTQPSREAMTPSGGTPRGTFSTNVITLLAKADLSTFLHESGHFYLEVLADLAALPNAPAEIADDMGKVLDWFGIKAETTGEKGKRKTVERTALEVWRGMTLAEQREHHEKFARGFEAYLFEGKTPAAGIERVFDRFKTWMMAVYKTVKALNVDLNPEVRGVFDRLLGSQDEIRQAEASRGMMALFKDAKDAGMTDAEWRAYQNLGAEATADAVEQLQSRSLRDMKWLSNARSRALRALQKEADAKRKAVRAEVAAEVDALPIERARAMLRKAAETDPEVKARIKAWEAQRAEQATALTAAVKAEYLARIPEVKGMAKGQYLAKNRRDIANEAERRVLEWEKENPRPVRPKRVADMDGVAEATGFTSGDHLAAELAAAPARTDLIDARTDQRMLERYGDLADQQAIERAVDDALHNDARARFVATELSALDKALGKPRVLMAAAKQFAADLIGRKQIKALRTAPFKAAEVRAAREAGGTKDVAARAIAKRNQLLNHYAARAAGQALDDIESGVVYLKRVEASTSLPPEYADQIGALLERYDLRTSTTNKAIARRESLADWVQAQNDMGIEPDIPPALLRELDRRSYKELTVDEFRGLVDTVKQIEHLGRLKNKLLTAKDAREFQAVVDDLVSSIEANSRGRTADTRTPNTLAGQALVRVKAFGAAHIKAATWARVMDGGRDGGPMWERLIRTANEAGDRETAMRAEATRDLAALVEPLLADGPMGGKGVVFPTINRSLNREARLAIALNWGNAGNRQRLLDGEGWSEAQVQPVLQSLTAKEWQFVQSVWDYFEAYRPEIAAKERRVYGREPNWVEPVPFEASNSTGAPIPMRGGYYPIKYDPRASERAESHNEAEEAKSLMRAAYTSATTRRSFAKPRADEVHGRPLLYSLDGIYGGVQEVIHDLTWHEWLIDANRLVKNKSISAAIRGTYGPEVHQQLKAWLQDVAQGDKPARDAGEAALSWLRQGVSVAGLGLNVMNAIMQPLGLTQSIVRIGPQWVGKGIARAIGSPIQTAGEISGLSTFMRDRFRTQWREVNEVRNQVKGQGRVRRSIDAAAYVLMIQAQRMVDIPTWWGAYEKALAAGNADDRAAALADQAVIDSQGSGMVKDLSAIERGAPALKIFTVFYSFFNTTLNLGVGRTMTADSKLKLAADYILLFTIPALLGTAMKDALTPGDAGDAGDDDDMKALARKALGAQLSFLFGLMFGVRELGALANIAAGEPFGRDYQGPAGLRLFGDLAALGQQVDQGEVDDALRRAIVNTSGTLLRLPAAQINRTITGAEALIEGDTQNPAALLLGYQEPR